eukprot:TRINITY_DN331_c0_g1_i1.p1 TRINITY_DN331_c0_g1~~TRINITY_DN331_c0_g1_i1.p1  ORF type:complete len:354 (-),score=107.43 TRINITY_DN331_c0_g1_i1:72-1133(-)
MNYTQYKYIETNEVDSKLKCTICENPFEKPRSCQMCGKRFCLSCIKDKKECPECKDTTDWDACPTKFTEQLLKLKVFCIICEKEMTKKEFDSHFSGCKITKCEGSIYGCDFIDKAIVVIEHQKTCFKACLLTTRKEFEEKLEIEKKKRIVKQKEMVARMRILETELDTLRKSTKPETVEKAMKNRKVMIQELENKFKKERQSIDKNGKTTKSPIKKTSTPKTPDKSKNNTKKSSTPIKSELKSTTATKTLASKTEAPKKNDTPKKNETKEDKPKNNKTETKTLVSNKDTTEKSNETNKTNEMIDSPKKEVVNEDDYKDTVIPTLITKKKKKSNTQETESSQASGSKKRKKNPK